MDSCKESGYGFVPFLDFLWLLSLQTSSESVKKMDVNAPIPELMLDEAGWIIVGHYLPPWDVIVVGVGWEPSLLTKGRGKDGMKIENWKWIF